jgi:hypothetical protein
MDELRAALAAGGMARRKHQMRKQLPPADVDPAQGNRLAIGPQPLRHSVSSADRLHEPKCRGTSAGKRNRWRPRLIRDCRHDVHGGPPLTVLLFPPEKKTHRAL